MEDGLYRCDLKLHVIPSGSEGSGRWEAGLPGLPDPSLPLGMTSENMQGRIDLETLQGLAIDGVIETLIAVLPHMYRRLVGKRFNARYFLDDIAENGIHACDYLLACNMD